MIDFQKMMKAQADGICFLCRTCSKYYSGESAGLKDAEGYVKCLAKNGCCGPIGGKSFDEYDGPLAGHFDKVCYLCGDANPKYAIRAKKDNAKVVGVCEKHIHVVKKLTVGREGTIVVFIAESVAPKDNYEVLQ